MSREKLTDEELEALDSKTRAIERMAGLESRSVRVELRDPSPDDFLGLPSCDCDWGALSMPGLR